MAALMVLPVSVSAKKKTADLKVGMEIEFMGAPCHERTAQALDTPEGKDAFACERYGYPELETGCFTNFADGK